jgi:hypothetical protein
MMLQAAVNGDRSKADHPAVPVTGDELIRDVRECLACPTAPAPATTPILSPPPAAWGQEPPDRGKHGVSR